MAAREVHAAYTEMLTVLKGINGSTGGYWLNVEGRVYERLLLPEEVAKGSFPYIAAPLSDDTPRFIHDEQRITIVWNHEIHLFVKETATSQTESSSALQALKGRSDVMRALMRSKVASGFLAGKVDDLSFISGGGIYGAIDPDDTWAEAVIPVELSLGFAVSDLGPDA